MTTMVRRGSATLAMLVSVACRPDAPEFGPPEVVSAPTNVGAAPMFALSPRGARVLAWVSAPEGGSDGRLYASVDGGLPTELRDSSGGIEPHGEAPPKLSYGPDGTLYALYAVGKLVPGRRFPHTTLRLVRSNDDGRTWSAPSTVALADSMSSRNFHAMHAGRDGALYVAWLESAGSGKSGAYITRSTDAGATWAPPVRADSAEACPCCRTAIATGGGDTVYLAWRTVLPGNIRDVVVARSVDAGRTWSSPERVHADDWSIEACPHAGPSMIVDGRGRVHVAWWTGARGRAGAYYARSDDRAASFSAPVALGVAAESRPSHPQLALRGVDTVVIAWDDGTVHVPQVRVRVSIDGGHIFGDAVTLSSEERAGSFPVLALGHDAITVAWSEQGAADHAHGAASRPNMRDPKAVMPLPTVGKTRVVLRRAKLDS
jgi:hypothetical protein